jgi:hypothetical protein
MKNHLKIAFTLIALASYGTLAVAQDHGQRGGQNKQETAQFNEHDQQVTHDWYSQHQSHPAPGFRNQDRLSNDEETRIHEGGMLDGNLRGKVHSAPPDLTRQLPTPPRQHRYVAIGSHVALIDRSYQVKSVIHLHDNH